MNAPAKVSIEIFSDVMCPWCVIGYKRLQQALGTLDGEIEADIRWQPFELNALDPVHESHVATLGQERLIVHEAPHRQQFAHAASVGVVTQDPSCAYQRLTSIVLQLL